MICASLEYTSCACFLTKTLADGTRNTFFYRTRFFRLNVFLFPKPTGAHCLVYVCGFAWWNHVPGRKSGAWAWVAKCLAESAAGHKDSSILRCSDLYAFIQLKWCSRKKSYVLALFLCQNWGVWLLPWRKRVLKITKPCAQGTGLMVCFVSEL